MSYLHGTGLVNHNVAPFLKSGRLNLDEASHLPNATFLLTYVTALAALKGSSRKPTSFNCDFESECSGWSQGNDVQWGITNRSLSNFDHEPRIDHTLQTAAGRIAYLDYSRGFLGSFASLYSPIVYLDEYPQYCLRFWYLMRGDDFGILNVYLIISPFPQNTTGERYLIYSRRGPSTSDSTEWKQQRINIFSPLGYNSTSSIQFEFEGKVRINQDNHIAIDDISLEKGICELSMFNISTLDSKRNLPFLNQTISLESIKSPYEKRKCREGDINKYGRSCCGGLYPYPEEDCCGKNLYRPAPAGLGGCCGGVLYINFANSCCGKKFYDIKSNICINGKYLVGRNETNIP